MMPSSEKLIEKVFILIFLICLSAPLAFSLLLGSDSFSRITEKRQPAEMPKLPESSAELGKFPKAFEKYFDDNFGLRADLIRLYGLLKYFLYGVSPVSNAIAGKDGWMFLANGNILADHRNAEPFTEEQLNEWVRVLEAKRNWLAAKGIRYLFVVVPDKHSIYPEAMPAHLTKIGAKSRLDQFIEHVRSRTDVDVLDLRPALVASKHSTRVYHLTDSHWNDEGAFVAYGQIAQWLSSLGALRQPLRREQLDFREEVTVGLDLALMMGVSELTRERVPRLRVLPTNCTPPTVHALDPRYGWKSYQPGHEAITRRCAGAGKIVMFHDSFGPTLAPFLAEHFAEAVFIWDYPDRSVLLSAILQESPDIVIEQRVERHLKAMAPVF